MPRSSKTNPCPICHKDHGCLVDDPVVVCLRKVNEDVPGYRYLKPAEGGMGGVYVNENSDVKPAKESYKVPERKSEYITDSELDKSYRLLSTQFGIDKKHKSALLNRGLSDTDHLASLGFYSHVPNRKVDKAVRDVPGVKSGLLKGSTGLFIPARNVSNQIVGGQIWTQNQKAKYMYLKGGTTCRRNNGSLQFLALPYVADGKHTLPLTLKFSVSEYKSDTEGEAGCGVGILLLDELGNEVKVISKLFSNTSRILGLYNALLCGIQAAYKIGTSFLSIQIDPRLSYEFLNDKYKNPEIKFIRDNAISYLKRIKYKFVSKSGSYNRVDALASNQEKEINSDFTWDTREVYLVDGALKAYIAAEKHNKVVLGCPGGTHVNSPDLITNIKALNPLYIIHAPDAGDVVNTAQIPAVNTGLHKHLSDTFPKSKIRIAWWGQLNKGDSKDFDEFYPGEIKIDYITPREYLNLHSESQLQSLNLCSSSKGGLLELPDVENPRSVEYKKPKEFDGKDRLNVFRSYLSTHKFILDRSPAGTGKSTAFSSYTSDQLNTSRIVYVSQDPVTIDENWDGWSVYRGRDNGRFRRKDNRVTRDSNKAVEEIHKSNCVKADLSDYLISRSIVPTSAKLCFDCPFKSECGSNPGWYLRDREITLKSPRIRTSVAGLADYLLVAEDGKPWDKTDCNLPGTTIILDDVDPWVESKSFTVEDVKTFLLLHTVRLFKDENLYTHLMGLIKLLEDNGNKYLTKTEVYDEFGDSLNYVKSIDPSIVESITEIEQESILTNSDSPLKQWFGHLYDALQEDNFYFHLDKGVFHITLKNNRVIELLHHPAVKNVIISDATAKVEYLERFLDTQILSLSQKRPETEGELRFLQVSGLGDYGYSRSKKQKERAELIREWVKKHRPRYGIIDTKASVSDDLDSLELSWRSTSRGSNRARDAHGLVLFGTPRSNLSSLRAYYSIMSNLFDVTENSDEIHHTTYPMGWQNNKAMCRGLKESSHEGFAEFCHQNILAEIEQGASRLRAIRRPGETLEVIFVSEYPIADLGYEINGIHFSELIGSKFSVTASKLDYRLVETKAGELISKNKKLTQASLAKSLGVSRDVITQFFALPGRDWSDFKAKWVEESNTQAPFKVRVNLHNSEIVGDLIGESEDGITLSYTLDGKVLTRTIPHIDLIEWY